MNFYLIYICSQLSPFVSDSLKLCLPFVCPLKPILALARRDSGNCRGFMRWTRNARDNMRCLPPSLKAFLPTVQKWAWARSRLVAISVGSLSTQGLFRPLPPITWLIGNHLSHTWMRSSHEEEVRPLPEATKPFFAGFHYPPRSTLSPLTDHKQQVPHKLLKLSASNSSSGKKVPFKIHFFSSAVSPPLGCTYIRP